MKTYITSRVNKNEFFVPFERHFNEFFDNFFKSPLILDNKHGYPRLDVFERNVKDTKEFVVKATVPGLKSEDIIIEISDENILTISGKYPSNSFEKLETNYYIQEFSSSSFSRSIRIPENVKGDPKVDLLDGILTLSWSISQVDDSPKIRKIQIKKNTT